MKHTAPIYVYMEFGYDWSDAGSHEKAWRPSVKGYKTTDKSELVYIGQQSVTVEVPDDFNPVPAQVAALEKEKLAALAAYQKKVADINERLSKLLAITNEVEATPNEEADHYDELQRGYAQDRI